MLKNPIRWHGRDCSVKRPTHIPIPRPARQQRTDDDGGRTHPSVGVDSCHKGRTVFVEARWMSLLRVRSVWRILLGDLSPLRVPTSFPRIFRIHWTRDRRLLGFSNLLLRPHPYLHPCPANGRRVPIKTNPLPPPRTRTPPSHVQPSHPQQQNPI
jgi:hypothetical protein